MYALVLWSKSKKSGVIKETELRPNKEEGDETYATSNGRLYKVKIVRKNDDLEYLERLTVNTDGEVLIKGKNTSATIALKEKDVIKENFKIQNKKQTEALRNSNRNLIKFKDNLNEDNASEQESESDEEIDLQIRKAEEEVKALKKEKINKRKTQDSKSLLSKPSCSFLPPVYPAPRETENDDSDEDNDEVDPVAKRPKIALKERYIVEHEEEIQVQDDNPLVVCRQGGNGRSQLAKAYNVWVDAQFLCTVQRHKSDPKEMTRSLLKEIVGKRNLMSMCARGTSKKRKKIPQDIVSCVEYYVNITCAKRLTPSEFTDVINYMIGTLRAAIKKEFKD